MIPSFWTGVAAVSFATSKSLIAADAPWTPPANAIMFATGRRNITATLISIEDSSPPHSRIPWATSRNLSSPSENPSTAAAAFVKPAKIPRRTLTIPESALIRSSTMTIRFPRMSPKSLAYCAPFLIVSPKLVLLPIHSEIFAPIRSMAPPTSSMSRATVLFAFPRSRSASPYSSIAWVCIACCKLRNHELNGLIDTPNASMTSRVDFRLV